jgi:two-component system, OmpR family, alkaline phosphatase synthesis response regulator PhoP
MSKRILVVDDELSIREAISKVLRVEGYDVVTAENGEEAIEKIKSEKIDLLLLDLGLPVKDGWDTVIWLTQVNPLLPVIIITGRWNQRELARKMGADALMDKPLDIPRLLQTIRKLINEPVKLRARHAKQRSSFQYVPCDHELFLEKLRERSTTPYRCPGLENH